MIDYLTNHDLVWINTTVTGKVCPFDYIRLEAIMAAQYQYGKSNDVPLQASFFLHKMQDAPAFSEGNLRTTFIALLTFLNANGYATRVGSSEAAEILLKAGSGSLTPSGAIEALSAPAEKPLTGLTLRQIVTHECNLHVEALKLLASKEAQ